MSARPVRSPAVRDAPPGVCVGELGVGGSGAAAGGAVASSPKRCLGTRLPRALRSGLAVLLSPGKRTLKMSVLRKTDFSRSHTSLFQKM